MSFIDFIVFQMKTALTLLFRSIIIISFSWFFIFAILFLRLYVNYLNFTKIAFSFQVSFQAYSDFFFLFFFCLKCMHLRQLICHKTESCCYIFLLIHTQLWNLTLDFSLVHMLFRNRLLNVKPDKDFQNFGYLLLF